MMGKLFDRILFALAWAAAVILLVVTLSIDVDVVRRYIFRCPLVGVIDIAEFALLYMLFLGTTWLLAKDKHVKIDILLVSLPRKTQHIVNTISSSIAALAVLMLCIFGWIITWEAFQANAHLTEAIIVPKAAVYVVIPFGSSLLTIQFIRRARNFWIARNAPEKELAQSKQCEVGSSLG